MLKIDRTRIIEDKIKKNGSILISNLSKDLDCSEETIRRDLALLEKEGKLIRVHGGAYISEDFEKGVPIQIREFLFSDVKNSMAQVALTNFVKENDSIFIDNSTTCLALGKLILESEIKVTIITNSFKLCKLSESNPKNAKIICTGGRLRHHHGSFEGCEAIESIKNYYVDSCFLSPPAIDLEFGLLDNSRDSGLIRHLFIEHSKKRYLIADHTKFFDKADVIISNINKLDAIITDSPLNSKWEETAKNNSLDIFYSNK